MELVLEIVLQFLLELFGNLVLELGWEGAKRSLRRENHHPMLAALGFLVLGAVVGGVSVLIHPGKFVENSPIPGMSLVLAPLLIGASMHAFGTYRRTHGHSPTNLATFLGGATFAFAMAAVRFAATR